jgi:hypothetical protein
VAVGSKETLIHLEVRLIKQSIKQCARKSDDMNLHCATRSAKEVDAVETCRFFAGRGVSASWSGPKISRARLILSSLPSGPGGNRIIVVMLVPSFSLRVTAAAPAGGTMRSMGGTGGCAWAIFGKCVFNVLSTRRYATAKEKLKETANDGNRSSPATLQAIRGAFGRAFAETALCDL